MTPDIIYNSTYSIDDLPSIASQVVSLLADYPIAVFKGELGAGKTTLIKSIVKQLEIDELVSSPTFTVINEYQSGQNKVYHMDLYRLKNLDEALEIGIQEIIEDGNICLIEWPEIIESLLPEHFIYLKINHLRSGQREITIYKF